MLLANVSAQVPTLLIIGLFNFICIAKQLRNDILLAQPAEEPEDEALGVLPPSVTKLLADSCAILLEDRVFHSSRFEADFDQISQ
jgi:hypothetical protein